jgi:hypothetical protein
MSEPTPRDKPGEPATTHKPERKRGDTARCLTRSGLLSNVRKLSVKRYHQRKLPRAFGEAALAGGVAVGANAVLRKVARVFPVFGTPWSA